MSGDEFSDTDLFGDPFLAPAKGRGRPGHQPTRISRNRVLMGLVRGLRNRDIAMSIGVSVTTMQDYYKGELKLRRIAALKFEQRQLERLNALAEGGNVAAERELTKRIDALRMRDQHQKDAARPTERRAALRLGKKETAQQRAEELTGLYDPPPAPMVN